MGQTKTFHIEARLLHRVNQCLYSVRLAVAWRANKQNTAFPGNTILFACLPCPEELRQDVLNILFQTALQYQVIKACAFNILKEMGILVPTTIVKYHHLTPYLHIPLAN